MLFLQDERLSLIMHKKTLGQIETNVQLETISFTVHNEVDPNITHIDDWFEDSHAKQPHKIKIQKNILGLNHRNRKHVLGLSI